MYYAALKWESDPRGAAEHVDTLPSEGSKNIDAGSNSRVGDDVAMKKAKTIRAAGHLLVAAKATEANVASWPRHQIM